MSGSQNKQRRAKARALEPVAGGGGKVKKLHRLSGGRFKRGNPFRKQRQYFLVAAAGEQGKEGRERGKRLPETERNSRVDREK